ncbi:MAG: AAA family ATPase [Mailhella sp.]|nr:AAA family ATPase [Mailhella sp.]
MDYPHHLSFKVNRVFGDQNVNITLYSGLTTFVGTNASGKTQTLKTLRDHLKNNNFSVRYLSSNRIGEMETFRSRVDPYTRSEDGYSLGDQAAKKARQEIETANGDFFTMDACKDVYIKVAERLSVLFNRQVFIRWDAGRMKVVFCRSGSDEEYSIVAEASGLINVISILAAIFDEDIEILLIDEPEVSLHPQLQSYLLREIKNAIDQYNKTIIISTHSAQMIDLSSASELCNFVFFKKDSLPMQISPDAQELKNNKLNEFLLRMSLIYAEGFFAKKMLLIEGSSDMILCRYLDKRLYLNLDVAGSQIIPVEGKGQFAVITKLFRLIGKDVCILTDLDGFIDDNSVVDLFSRLPDATKIANSHGHSDLQTMIRDIKNKISELVRINKTNMEDIYKRHPYWITYGSDEADKDKVIRRALIAQLFNESEDNLSNWPNSSDWHSLKCRITTLYSLLEDLGCFILRRGAVESYYEFASTTTYNGKPSAAAHEVSQLDQKDDEQLCEQYADFVRALKFAALDKNVDESFAVKKELLSELALVLELLPHISTEEEIYSSIKQTKGNFDSLFRYEIIKEDSRCGVKIYLKSEILEVEGFPFNAYIDDNVNQIINMHVRRKL